MGQMCQNVLGGLWDCTNTQATSETSVVRGPRAEDQKVEYVGFGWVLLVPWINVLLHSKMFHDSNLRHVRVEFVWSSYAFLVPVSVSPE